MTTTSAPTRRGVHAVVLLCVMLVGAAQAQTLTVLDSPHDLSASSRAEVRAAVEDQVCIFCHTPHNASPVGALWNRSLSPQAYTVYTSRALDAHPGQPTGTSKLCLSCHDGTIALGSVLSSPTPLQMAGGITTLQGRLSNLGTDLRDDHPISFQYDSSLAVRDQKLRDPAGLPHEIRLDNNRELQCTSCHDAHNNAFGNFLVMRNTSSELCTSCHQMGTTDVSGHTQCDSCHQSHTAPSGPYLLRRQSITQTCLTCHDGSNSAALNVSADTHKAFNHDTNSPVDPDGNPNQFTTCASCHEPHTMMKGVGATPPLLTGPRTTAFGRMGRIAGVNVSGSTMTLASAEHEVCFKCHGDNNPVTPSIPRRQPQSNMRLQLSPSAVSFHPVGRPGVSTEVPSLKPGWSTSSTMQCSDCHASDATTTSGEHGSTWSGLLVSRYSTADRTSESAANYGLCYRCHDRTSILNDRSFKEHKKHIVDQRTPCSVCHDSHGIAANNGTVVGNSHLINFDTTVVTASRTTGRLEYRDTGVNHGECYLSCHGENHGPYRY